MTLTASQAAEMAINKIEQEELTGGADADTTPKPGAAGAADDSAGKPAAGKDDKPAGGADDDTPKYDKDGKRIEAPKEDKPELDKDGKPVKKDDEGEFTADDALEVDDDTPKPKADDKPAAPTDNAGIQLSPDEQKYIVENIGEPIILRGITGTGDDAKAIEIKAFGPQSIPADFKFASEGDRLAAQQAFDRLETKAQTLLGQFRENARATNDKAAMEDYEKRENEGIKADLADLQKAGDFPKFKVQPGAAGFEDDPAAKQMQEVMDIMTERNKTFMDLYNQGRQYKHIGFAEAFVLWQAKQAKGGGGKSADDTAAEAQAKEDAERKAAAEKGADINRGTTGAGTLQKPRVRSGMTIDDIVNAHDND